MLNRTRYIPRQAHPFLALLRIHHIPASLHVCIIPGIRTTQQNTREFDTHTFDPSRVNSSQIKNLKDLPRQLVVLTMGLELELEVGQQE